MFKAADGSAKKIDITCLMDNATSISAAKKRLNEQIPRARRDVQWTVRDRPTPIECPLLKNHREQFDVITANLRIGDVCGSRGALVAILSKLSMMLRPGGIVVFMYLDGIAALKCARFAMKTRIGGISFISKPDAVRMAVLPPRAAADVCIAPGVECGVMHRGEQTAARQEHLVDPDVLAAESARVGLVRLRSEGCHFMVAHAISRGDIKCDDDMWIDDFHLAIGSASMMRMEAYIKDTTPEGVFAHQGAKFLRTVQ
jgi:hypothetical protein